jgi:hypothetical protein
MLVEWALLALPVAMPVLVALVAIWGAMGRTHWFLRFAGNCMLPALCALMRPPAMLELIAPQAAATALLMFAFRLMETHSGTGVRNGFLSFLRQAKHASFSVQSLMLAVVSAAIVAWIFRLVPGDLRQHWGAGTGLDPHVYLAVSYASLAPPVYWAVRSRIGRGMGPLIVLCLSIPLLTTWLTRHLGRSELVWLLWPDWLNELSAKWGWIALLGLHALLLDVTLWAFHKKLPNHRIALAPQQMAADLQHPAAAATGARLVRWAGNLVRSAFAVAILGPPCVLFFATLAPVPKPATNPLGDNHFDDLMEIAGELPAVSLRSVDFKYVLQYKLVVGDLRQIATSVSPQASAARNVLSHPCQATAEFAYQGNYTHVTSHALNWDLVERLQTAFHVQARLAQLDGRLDDEIQAGLDLLRLGSRLPRGGLFNDYRLCRQIELEALAALHARREQLMANQCRMLIAALQERPEREPLEDVAARTWAFELICFDWEHRLRVVRGWLTAQELQHGLEEKRLVAAHGCLAAELAVRAYQVETGELPDSLEELVPRYLNAVPRDPFRDAPLQYWRMASDYIVYSVGADGQDDGGLPGPDLLIAPP